MLPYFVWEDSLVYGAGMGRLGMCLYVDVVSFGLAIISQCLCIYLFSASDGNYDCQPELEAIYCPNWHCQ
jgi:hypothetical protein